jgi:hypothetical protein
MQSQHQGRRALPCFREDGPRQQGLVAITGPTTVGWKGALYTEQAPSGVATVRAHQTIRVEMLFEPTRATVVIQSLVDRKVYHRARIPQLAR